MQLTKEFTLYIEPNFEVRLTPSISTTTQRRVITVTFKGDGRRKTHNPMRVLTTLGYTKIKDSTGLIPTYKATYKLLTESQAKDYSLSFNDTQLMHNLFNKLVTKSDKPKEEFYKVLTKLNLTTTSALYKVYKEYENNTIPYLLELIDTTKAL